MMELDLLVHVNTERLEVRSKKWAYCFPSFLPPMTTYLGKRGNHGSKHEFRTRGHVALKTVKCKGQLANFVRLLSHCFITF